MTHRFSLLQKPNQDPVDFLCENLDPAKLDLELLGDMAEKYGGGLLTPEKVKAQPKGSRMGGIIPDVEIDEFKACKITSVEEIKDLFAVPFYFGCEADDRLNAVAFDKRLNHFDVELKAIDE